MGLEASVWLAFYSDLAIFSRDSKQCNASVFDGIVQFASYCEFKSVSVSVSVGVSDHILARVEPTTRGSRMLCGRRLTTTMRVGMRKKRSSP